MSATQEKLQPGKCRYALPWNPCHNQQGNQHHGECVNPEYLAERLVMAILVPEQREAAIWVHDTRNLSWPEILSMIIPCD